MGLSTIIKEFEEDDSITDKDDELLNSNRDNFVYIIAKNIKEKVINAILIKDKNDTHKYMDDDVLIKFSNYSEEIIFNINSDNITHLYTLNMSNKEKNSSNNSICLSTDNSIDHSR